MIYYYYARLCYYVYDLYLYQLVQFMQQVRIFIKTLYKTPQNMAQSNHQPPNKPPQTTPWKPLPEIAIFRVMYPPFFKQCIPHFISIFILYF